MHANVHSSNIYNSQDMETSQVPSTDDPFKNMWNRSSLVAQWVKDPALSLQWLWLLLWHGFDPWPRNFHMPWAQPKKNLNYKDFKKDVVYIYICIYVLCTCINTMEYYLAIKKELNIATCNNIDGPREYHNE